MKNNSTDFDQHIQNCQTLQNDTQRVESYLERQNQNVPQNLQNLRTELQRYTEWAQSQTAIITAAFQQQQETGEKGQAGTGSSRT